MAWQQWQRSAFARVREPFARKGENGVAHAIQRPSKIAVANQREGGPLELRGLIRRG
jgi:hypothetical protein